MGRWLNVSASSGTWNSTIAELPRNAQGVWQYQLGTVTDVFKCSYDDGWSNNSYGCYDNLTLQFNAYDPDGDSIAYDIVAQTPAGSGVEPSYTAVMPYVQDNSQPVRADLWLENIKAPGDYQFTLQLVDGSNASAPETLRLQVADYPADYSTLELWYAPFTCRQESLSHDYPCTGSADGSDLTIKRHLPAKRMTFQNGQACTDNYNNNCYQTWKNGGIKQYFKLTAVGRDYTLNNLKLEVRDAQSSDAGSNLLTNTRQPRFVGITEGTVIREGESLIFGVELPQLPAPAAAETSYWYLWSFEVPALGADGVFKREQQFKVPAQ